MSESPPIPSDDDETVLSTLPVSSATGGRVPSSIERYTVTGPVTDGRGGMGVVYRARDTQLQREVALKLMTGGAVATPLERKRFLLEAGATARLSHPNIMPVYDYGDSDEGPWFVMPLVEGGSLAGRIKQGPMQPDEAVALMIPVCEGVAHAHALGILHRDLKPANIMLTSQGTPIVADFGLAKRLGDFTQLTATGTVMGTPSYMPPEQALGLPVNELADVFSLGAILYALVTGRPPAQAETPVETLRQVIEEIPPRPSTLAPGVDGPLNLIILTCLEKAAEHRYLSAAALAEDLRRWQRHEAISAKRHSHARTIWKWAQRKPAKATAAAIAILGSLAFVTMLIINQGRLRRERDDTDTFRQSSENLVATAITDYRAKVESTVGELDALQQIATSAAHHFAQLPARLRDARVEALHSRVLTLQGEILRSQGKLAESASVLDQAVKTAALADAAKRALLSAAALVVRADVALQQDDPTATNLAQQAVQAAETAIHSAPADLDAVRQAGLAVFFQGRCEYKAGQYAAASLSLATSIERAALVSASDPTNLQKSREHAWALVESGRVLKNLAAGVQRDLRSKKDTPSKHGDEKQSLIATSLQKASAQYEQARAVITPLLTRQPWNQPLRRDYCVIQDGLGDVALTGLADAESALRHYTTYLDEAKTLAAHDPQNKEWLREVAAAHRALASALTSLQRHPEATTHMDEGITLRQRLLTIDPSDGKLRRDYCNALIERGDAHLAQAKANPEHNDTARRDYETADTLAREQLTSSDAAWWETKRVGLLARRGITTRDKTVAIPLLQEAIALADKIKTLREDPIAQNSRATAKRALERMQNP